MTIISELNLQNHKLTESSNVLLYLLKERAMCDTETSCELLSGFINNMNDHLVLVGSLYKDLLSDKSSTAKNTARMFMSGEHELKRIITQYTKKWCKKNSHQLRIADHDSFKRETQDLFEMVLSRIQNETEHLYPLVRDITYVKQVAA